MTGFIEQDDLDERKPEAVEEPAVGDDRLVKVMIKIRSKIAEITKAYEEQKKGLDAQMEQLQNEVIRRLHERGATQTKTPFGTAFLGERMTSTIADEQAFNAFILAEQDPTYLQKRVKMERLKEYMDEHGGQLPPGLSIFREVTLNVRAK